MPRRAAILIALFCLPGIPLSAQELLDRININGYTNFEFEKMIDKQGAGDKNGSFDADQFNLVFNIHATDRVRVAADVSWEHGAATEDGRGNVALEYGFVEYTISNLFKLRAGKMLTPFGVFNEIHTAKPAFVTVKEAPSLNKTERIIKGTYRYYPRWGAGLALHGDGVVGGKNFNYDLVLANGEQENTNPFEEDDNGFKSVTARFRLEPSESVRIGWSLYVDKTTDPAFRRIVSNGLEFEWTHKSFRLLAEAAVGDLERDDGSGPDVRQKSFYVQPTYRFGNGVTPYLRFEWIDSGIPDESGTLLTTGLNWEITRNFMLKAENDWFHGSAKSNLGQYPGSGYSEIKAALVLGF
jgi:hypothetical protein